MDNRPHSRPTHQSSGSAHAEKRGSGNATGSHGAAGRTSGYEGHSSISSQRNSFSQGSQTSYRTTRSSGGFNPLILLILAAVVIFGGGTGLSSLFSSGSSTPTVSTPVGNTTGSSGNSSSVPLTYNAINDNAVDRTVASTARQRYTTLLGDGQDQVTIMVYLCGADLESQYGMATADLNEMLYGEPSENVNIIVETGGARKWQNSVISSSTNQRYQVTAQGLVPLDKQVGANPMTDPDTLESFVNFCKNNYPANRYMLILWDHGGGSVTGYGYDEKFPNSGSMSIDEVANALKATGVKFDFIGFDACLMATLETAVALDPVADYLIASEETEPGTGWYYTNWIQSLSKNPSMPTLDLAKIIIDDFITDSAKKSPQSQTTLSILDLAEFHGTVPSSLVDFAKNVNTLVKSDDYQEVATARANTREFAASSRIDQIDLVNFANNIGTTEATALANTIESCVKYNRTNNITNAYGVSLYFPYQSLSRMNSMVQVYNNIGMEEEYSSAIRSFATLASSGQIVTQSSGNSATSILETLLGGSTSSSGSLSTDAISSLLGPLLSGGSSSSFDLTSLLGQGSSNWLDSSLLSVASNFIGKNQVLSDGYTITEKNGEKVISLTEKQWSLVESLQLNVFVDDGDGYLDLGLDNVFTLNDDGDLVMGYDGTWLCVNNQPVAYYMTSDSYNSDEDWKTTGRIPALLNSQQVNLMVTFSNDNPYGFIEGAAIAYPETETETQAKGLIEIQPGDTLDFLCDYYGYDGTYQTSYFLGEPLVVDGTITLSNKTLDNNRLVYAYMFTDLYGSETWTPSLEY